MNRDDLLAELTWETHRAAPSLHRIAAIYGELKAELDVGKPPADGHRQHVAAIGQVVSSWRLCKSLGLNVRVTTDN